MHHELTGDLFAAHAFVGIVDDRRRLAAIQSGVKLYLVDYGAPAWSTSTRSVRLTLATLGSSASPHPRPWQILAWPPSRRSIAAAESQTRTTTLMSATSSTWWPTS